MKMVQLTSQIGRGEIRQRINASITLKPGQLITGKAIKFFANQHAQIQVGTMSLFAQLDTALDVNKTYLFQVMSVDQKPQLKKLVELSNHSLPSKTAKQLGIPMGKELDAIIRLLMEKNIAFTKSQLDSIHTLLKKYGNDTLQREVVLQMLDKGLPLTEETFLSIRAQKSQSSHHLVTQLSDSLSLKQPSDMVDLRSHLAVYLKGNSNVKQTALLSFFDQYSNKLAPLLEQRTTFSTQHIRNILQQPESQNFAVLKENLQQIINLQLAGTKSEIQSLERLYSRITGSLHSQLPVSTTDLTLLQQHPLIQKLMVKTQGEEKQLLELLTNRAPTQSQEALQHVRTILDQQLPMETTKLMRLLLLQMDGLDNVNQLPVKERLLQHMQHFIQASGLTDENQLLQSSTKQEVLSLKQAIMFHLPQVPETTAQRMEQFVHWITGTQLINTAVQNEQYVMHTFQIPGSSFGLEEDIDLEFQGKKNKNGQIDSDYCRILFNLTLANLGQTIITLGVQKRVVTITIFNDKDQQAKRLAHQWKGFLEQQLNSLDYHLSAINWKSLTKDLNPINKPTTTNNPNQSYNKKGFDWRI